MRVGSDHSGLNEALQRGRAVAEVGGMAKVGYSLPDGEYVCLLAYVSLGTDFTLDEAVARLAQLHRDREEQELVAAMRRNR